MKLTENEKRELNIYIQEGECSCSEYSTHEIPTKTWKRLHFLVKKMLEKDSPSKFDIFTSLSYGPIFDISNITVNGIPYVKENMLLSFDKTIIEDLSSELLRARAKFPSGYNLNFAAMEELGELVAAQMQNLPKFEIRKEAIQVMAMCVRIIEEGDKSLVITEETSQK
jgi:hypothetical protein